MGIVSSDDVAAIATLPQVKKVMPVNGGELVVRYGNIDYHAYVGGNNTDFPEILNRPGGRGQLLHRARRRRRHHGRGDRLQGAQEAVRQRQPDRPLHPHRERAVPGHRRARRERLQLRRQGCRQPHRHPLLRCQHPPVRHAQPRVRDHRRRRRPARAPGRTRHRPVDAAPAPRPARLRADQQRGDDPGRGEDPEHPVADARLDRRDLPAGRRDRRDEHHAHDRARTHPRDRHPHGHRRPPGRYPPPVPHRGGDALGGRRPGRDRPGPVHRRRAAARPGRGGLFLSAIVGAFSCALVTGLVFGFMPARKAAQLDPVAALASQ